MDDIIANSQTEAAIAKLRRGEATDSLRDEATAALLASMQTIIGELADMKKSLWSTAALKDLIDDRHSTLCNACPVRRWADAQVLAGRQQQQQKKEEESKKSWLQELLSSESIRYFILMLILIWAVIYVKTGPEGVDSVKGGVTGTVTGRGLK